MIYRVWCKERHPAATHGQDILADNPYIAAELWAEENDHDYAIADGEQVTVYIRDTVGTVTTLELTGHRAPEYIALPPEHAAHEASA